MLNHIFIIQLNIYGVNFFMSKLNIGIICGGNSSEHTVSLSSAETISKFISKEKYNVYYIGITKDGKWYLLGNRKYILDDSDWETNPDNQPAVISPDTNTKGLIIKNENKLDTIKLDAVIPVLHGKNGEDGSVQGLLQLSGIPVVGCDMVSSAACMDKVITNTMLTFNGINKAKFHWFTKYDFEKNPEKCVSETEIALKKYPMFVKPSKAGSSVGISKALNKEELINAIKIAAKEDEKILVEEAIVGKEVECAVLGNNELIASTVGEISPSGDFYDYESKYISGDSGLHIPARINNETAKEIRGAAKKAFKIMGCKGLSRVDFFVEDKTNKVLLNEINTFPGFTEISMYPKLIEKSGYPLPKLIDKLIELAIKKEL